MKRAVFQNRKCHSWNGDLLVMEKGCRHRLRKGEGLRVLFSDYTSGLRFDRMKPTATELEINRRKDIGETDIFNIRLFNYKLKIVKVITIKT